MKAFLALIISFTFTIDAQSASMTTPEATLNFLSADGKPVAGVALTGMLRYSVISVEDCTGFICIPSAPHRVQKSQGGEVLGYTDSSGVLKVDSLEWTVSKLTAKNLSVLFFTNGTIDVTCPGKNNEEPTFAGFIDLLPQVIDGKDVERDYDCSNLEFRKDDEKEIIFSCKSPLSMQEIQDKIAAIQSEKCN